MARVTARQAFTRAKTKRQKTRAELNRSLVEARARFVRQLSSLEDEATSDNKAAIIVKRKQPTNNSAARKITEFFNTTTSLDFMSRPKRPSPRTSVSVDPNGIELITIYDSDAENDSNNNNPDAIPIHRRSSKSDYDQSASSSTSDILNSPLQDLDIKPSNSDLTKLDSTFMNLQVNVRLDDDIEIVEMLPPIPLRDHPIFDIEDN